MIVSLPLRIMQLINQHGSLRAAARALQMDAGYLQRLKSCEKYAEKRTTEILVT